MRGGDLLCLWSVVGETRGSAIDAVPCRSFRLGLASPESGEARYTEWSRAPWGPLFAPQGRKARERSVEKEEKEMEGVRSEERKPSGGLILLRGDI